MGKDQQTFFKIKNTITVIIRQTLPISRVGIMKKNIVL